MNKIYHLLPQIYVFRKVAELGSFQAAANELGLQRSSVSKKIAHLENQLNQRLLQRSTRQLKLTEEGSHLLEVSAPLQNVIAATHAAKLTQEKEPFGKVKISSSTVIGRRFLLPLLAPMLEKYPKVQIELNLSDDLTDLLANGVDIALRVGHLADSSMVAKKIGVKGWACFASPRYLKNRTVLRHPQELSNHNCLAFQNLTQSMTCWSLTNAQEETHSIDIKPVIYSDDGRTLIELAIQALGIIYVDPLLVTKELQEGRLVEILPGWSSPAPSPINLVCLGHQARGKAVDAVWRFLSDQLPKTFK
jgi:DNA-binding transcriptional LysR family regulator